MLRNRTRGRQGMQYRPTLFRFRTMVLTFLQKGAAAGIANLETDRIGIIKLINKVGDKAWVNNVLYDVRMGMMYAGLKFDVWWNIYI